MPKIGYIGQRKSDGKWFAHVQVNGQDETKRTRVLSREEEIRLLKACETLERDHLIPLIIFAVDTGMRKGKCSASLGQT